MFINGNLPDQVSVLSYKYIYYELTQNSSIIHTALFCWCIHISYLLFWQERGYVEFKASMGKQLAFCKPGEEDAAREEEKEMTWAKFVTPDSPLKTI